MKKIILAILIVTGYIYAWETTTHRAIDKTAIESGSVGNLIKFIDALGIILNYYVTPQERSNK